MRTFAYLFAIASLACWNPASCLAQQPTGPATLENLLNSNESPKTAEADASPKQPAGTVARPEDGVQHPDLDKAWADYEAAVVKVTESMKAAISKQFDAATAKGDLDAAEKWQNALEKFEEAGELPKDKETKTPASEAAAGLRKAGEELVAAYEAVVKNVTMEKKLAEAKVVRDEMKLVSAKVRLRQDSPPREEGAKINSTQLVGGPGGGGFEDQPPQGAKVVGVVIRSGELLDAIQVVYRLPNGRLQPGNHHGGNGGGATTFELMLGETIIGVSGMAGGVVGGIRLHTNKRVSKVLGVGAHGHNIPFELSIPAGGEFVGFTGRSGDMVDAVGLRYRLGQ